MGRSSGLKVNIMIAKLDGKSCGIGEDNTKLLSARSTTKRLSDLKRSNYKSEQANSNQSRSDSGLQTKQHTANRPLFGVNKLNPKNEVEDEVSQGVSAMSSEEETEANKPVIHHGKNNSSPRQKSIGGSSQSNYSFKTA